MSDDKWERLALCRGASPKWIDEVLFSESTIAAEKVRESYCVRCIVRSDCLEFALEQEYGRRLADRHGVYGGLGAAQRHSLEKRGGYDCPMCGIMFDPLQWLDGHLRCDACGHEIETTAIPPEGDEWNERHTKLAERVVEWIIENTNVGDKLPSPSALSRTLAARDRDMPRVYAALVADGTLRIDEGGRKPTYVRISQTSVMRQWRPPHLAA